MKRRRLTIIFFSVMALVATPQAMSHFSNYASSVHKQAEAEWLQFLVSFGAPSANEEATPSTQIAQQPTQCTASAEGNNAPVTAKSRGTGNVNSSSTPAKNRTFEFTFTEAGTAALDLLKQSQPKFDDVQFGESVLAKAALMLASGNNTLASNQERNEKGKYLLALLRGARLGERNSQRALERELTGLVSARVGTVPTVHVKFNRDPVEVTEPAQSVPDRTPGESRRSAEDTMR